MVLRPSSNSGNSSEGTHGHVYTSTIPRQLISACMYHVCTYVQQTAECRHCITIPGNSGNFGEQFSQKKNKKNSRKKCVQAAHHHAVAGVCLLTESQQYDALDKHGQSTRHLHTICKDHAKNRTPLKLWSWLIDWRGRLLVITSRVAISDAKLSQSKEQSLHKRHSLLLLNSYIAKSAQHKWTPSVGFNCLAVNSRSSRERAARTVHSPWLTVAVDWSIDDC